MYMHLDSRDDSEDDNEGANEGDVWRDPDIDRFAVLCAVSGLPVLSDALWGEPRHALFTRVHVLGSQGLIVEGAWRGEGRVGATDLSALLESETPPRVVLSHFWRDQSFADLPDNAPDSGEGAMHIDVFLEAVAAQATLGMLRTGEFAERYDELCEHIAYGSDQAARVLFERAKGEAGDRLMIAGTQVRQALLDAEDREDFREACASFDEQIRPHLNTALRPLAPMIVLGAMLGLEDLVVSSATREVMLAWLEGRPSRALDWHTILSVGPSGAARRAG